MGMRREPPRGLAAAGRDRSRRYLRHRRGADQAADRGAWVRRHQRRRRRDLRGVARRHLLRVRLSRRRPAAVRAQGTGRRFHPGVSGAADRAGDERADHTAVLLAHPAAGGARHGMAAGAHARGRRRGRPVDRRQHFPRHGRGAAVHPALYGTAHPQRIVSGDDRWHGRHRRHRAGTLRHPAGTADSRRRRAFRDRIGARCPRRHSDQPDHGARDRRPAHRRRAGRPRHAGLRHHGRHRQGHRRRPRTASLAC